MDLERARFNMIEQQIRPWDVLDPAVLDVMHRVPREAFVDSSKVKVAYADIEISIGHGEKMMHPRVEGRMLQSLNITPDDRCLEVGTGSGYVTACLAHLCAHVNSIDIHKEFVEMAEQRLSKQHIANVTLIHGDALNTASNEKYDAIAITGAMAGSTKVFEDMLNIGGRLFVVTGKAPIMQAVLVVRESEETFSRASLFETDLAYLKGAEATAEFTL